MGSGFFHVPAFTTKTKGLLTVKFCVMKSQSNCGSYYKKTGQKEATRAQPRGKSKVISTSAYIRLNCCFSRSQKMLQAGNLPQLMFLLPYHNCVQQRLHIPCLRSLYIVWRAKDSIFAMSLSINSHFNEQWVAFTAVE